MGSSVQGDLKKIPNFWKKVAQTVAKLKMTKYLCQNIYIKHLLNSINTYNKPYSHPKIHLRLKKWPKWQDFAQSGHPGSVTLVGWYTPFYIYVMLSTSNLKNIIVGCATVS
jgi:hypothetical protein